MAVTQSGLSVPAQSVVPRRLPCPSAATYSAPLRSARRSKASRREALIKRPSAIPASPGRSFQRHGSCCGRHDDEQLDVFDDDEVLLHASHTFSLRRIEDCRVGSNLFVETTHLRF